jgi:hypothetical protein
MTGTQAVAETQVVAVNQAEVGSQVEDEGSVAELFFVFH